MTLRRIFLTRSERERLDKKDVSAHAITAALVIFQFVYVWPIPMQDITKFFADQINKKQQSRLMVTQKQ